MRPRVLMLVALVSLAAGIWSAVRGIGPPAERAAGVSRDAAGEVELHYVLCGAQRVRFVRLLDYGESYGNGEVGPVMWQIRSLRGAAVRRVLVGRLPPGFHEEVNRLPLPGPSGLTVVTDANGDDIMSFRLADLRRNRVYRADYAYMTPRAFRLRGTQECPARERARRYQLASYTLLLAALATFGAALLAAVIRKREDRERAGRYLA
jgi:hypothetical protein